MPKEEWNNVYFSIMAMASVAFGALGVAIGLLALQRSQAQIAGVGSLETPGYIPLGVITPKVHYQDNEYLVSVRDPGEWHELRDFVQPTNPYVMRIIGSIYE